ncbi:MAG: fimbrillin family protein, partial [Muribaculaceae bacterium]|nr:fimbrillin family protein [Muribaculaceae bacterium]
IQFWAYAPTDPEKTKDQDVIKFSLTSSGAPNITDFTPASYTAAAAAAPVNSHNSGVGHEDLLLAYTNAQRADGTSAISLNFEHALSQIEVKATIGGDNDTQLTGNKYDVKVKGVWIANVKSSGNVTFDENKNNKLSWNVGNSKVVYGYEFDTPVSLDHTNSGLLVNNENAKSSLMLVPQELDKWDISSKDNNIKEKNPDNGAYILLLCRVEATHAGAEHPGNGDLVLGGTNTHIHQMFPVKDGDSNFNDKLYGYVCVPVSTTWEPGKKYIYNLEFCGQESGAGIYPPENDMDDLKLPDGNGDYEYIKTIPAGSGKKPGDPVLTDPIRFSVSVSSWDDAWKDGNEGNTPMN